jgi:hypothetical protein
MRGLGVLGLTVLVTTTVFAQRPPMGGPPPEAFSACSGQQQGSNCSFSAPRGPVEGTCRIMREQRLVCVPANAPMGAPGSGLGPGRGAGPNNRQGNGMGRGGLNPQGFNRGGGFGQGPGSGFRGRPKRVNIAEHDASAQPVASRIPDTNQGSCFDNNNEIPCPPKGQPFYGQDAQYEGAKPDYVNNGDGTVTDRVTGLMWQQGHNAKRLSWYRARQACANLDLGGHTDWRLPSIKELYSITDFRGASGGRPYLNDVFEIHKPGPEVLQGDRFASTHHTDMMGQTWSATLYTGDHWNRPGVEAAFFFNFLDGRIKQAPTQVPRGLFYRCVRGPAWGANDFVNNGNGTVIDRASDLMWQQADDGRTRNWEQALSYCANLKLAGHNDWRLPNVKELQSIVDYTRHDPAIDTRVFRQTDHNGWFWSSTTLGEDIRDAAYVCFGKCISVEGIDVHGAGAQRSDPKTGDPGIYRNGRGGQHDQVRIRNYVRCVRPAD